jgi:hypothetical protein
MRIWEQKEAIRDIDINNNVQNQRTNMSKRTASS